MAWAARVVLAMLVERDGMERELEWIDMLETGKHGALAVIQILREGCSRGTISGDQRVSRNDSGVSLGNCQGAEPRPEQQ